MQDYCTRTTDAATGLPGGFGCVWVPTSKTGRCTLLIYPLLPRPLQ